jgi:hypothetical protein
LADNENLSLLQAALDELQAKLITVPDFDFWFRELRTPVLLIDSARTWPDSVRLQLRARPLIALAISGDDTALAAALDQEEQTERLRDKDYWLPLKRELEIMRMNR